jgi:PEGA domain
MTPFWPASRREFIRQGFPTYAAIFLLADVARAQVAPSAVLFRAPAPKDAARLRSRVAPHAVDPVAAVTVLTPIDPTRLQELQRLEDLLLHAREQTAALAEADALATLAEAARIADLQADLPGAAAWNAEVQLALGVTAMQAGFSGLALDAFRRAATLDPSRRLLDAEASPAVVQAYAEVVREVALAPAGELEVRASVASARVYVDDLARGSAPVRLRLTVGRHVLRVEAPGHRGYGAFIDVLEGARPPLLLQLSPTPSLDAARALEAAVTRGDYEAVRTAMGALRNAGVSVEPVLVIEGATSSAKLLLVRCDADACRGPHRVRADAPWDLGRAPPLDAARLAAGRSWLAEAERTRSPEESPSLWTRWYVWGGVAVLAAVATGFALVADQQPAQHLRVVVAKGRTGP